MRVPLAIACLLLPLMPQAPARAQATDNVTIYRCTDARGHQSLRDSPCPRGQDQQAREMLRPKDAPASAPRSATAAGW